MNITIKEAVQPFDKLHLFNLTHEVSHVSRGGGVVRTKPNCMNFYKKKIFFVIHLRSNFFHIQGLQK